LSKLSDDIQLLEDKRSPKRRSAAKRLRKLGDVAAGPALLKRLKTEVLDPRTWETQYQLIMAIGECKYLIALPFLEALSKTKFEATMIYVAIGDALVRAIVAILEFVSKFEIDHGIRFWPLAASAGWHGDNVRKYISECSQSHREDLQHAAKFADEGKYYNWRPL